MKLIYYFSFIIILYFFSIYLTYSGQWLRVDSVATNTYKGISCADTQNCTAIGHWGAYLRNRVSSDGGFSWVTTLQDSVTPDHLPPEAFSVAYPDTGLCIIALDSGYYWQSNDKCRSWEKKRYRDSAYKIYYSFVNFINKNYGAILEWNKIFVTNNGANSWVERSIKFEDTTDNPLSLLYLTMTSENHIKVLAQRRDSLGNYRTYTIQTSDNGQSWVANPNMALRINQFSFYDDFNGWGVNRTKVNSNVYRDLIQFTSDGGRTWITQLDSILPIAPKGLNIIKCIDQNNAIALGPWWHLWRTNDGGKRWLRDTTYNQVFSGGIMSDYFEDVAYLKNNTIIGVQGLGSSIYIWEENTSGVDENSNSHDNFIIYPNPVIDANEFNVEFVLELPARVKLILYNSLGVMLDESEDIFINQGRHTYGYKPGVAMPAGVYFVEIRLNNRDSIIKSFIRL